MNLAPHACPDGESLMSTIDPLSPTTEPPSARKLRFPSAFTVLFVVTVAVWLLAFLIPTGQYAVDDETGRPVPGSYETVDAELTFGDRAYELYMAPVNGLYGVQDAETGYIGPYESGELFGAAGVFLFVLAIGVFITMTMQSGAIDAGIARIGTRFGGRALPLLILLMLIFAIGGTTEGMAEETLGFYGLVVPLALSLGYDRLTAAGIIVLGAGVGTLASTVNPFATGAASAAADVSIGDGIALRALMFVVLTAVTIAYVARYAQRVRKDPSRSLVGFRPEDLHLANVQPQTTPLTGRHKVVLWLMALTFTVMIVAIVPWAQIINGPDAASFAWQLDWYFPELAALFLVMGVVIGLIAGLGEKGMTDTIVSGAGDFIGAGLIIVLARGVTVIMNNSLITDTILNSLEDAVSGTSSALFGAAMFVVNVPLAFLVPSSSGHATLAMPVLAPLADFAGVGREIVVTAFQSASGWMNLFTPTSAVVMGGLALAGVGYNKFLRFIAPLLAILFVLILAFVAVGAMLS
jgi:uncharacterized ion transporter superfamily protein YfcC